LPRSRDDLELVQHLNTRANRAKQRGDLARAKAYLAAALKINPSNDESAFCYAEVAEAEGNLVGARKVYQNIATEGAKSVSRVAAFVALGNLELRQRRAKKAKQAFTAGLDVCTEDAPEWHRNWIRAQALCGLGILEGQFGNMIAASEFFCDGLRLAPNDTPLLVNTAWCYTEMGKPFEALFYLSRAIEIEPDRGDWLYELGSLYESVGETHLARLNYERALKSNDERAREPLNLLPPDTGDMWFVTGTKYEIDGQFDAAIGCYKCAIALGHARAAERVRALSAKHSDDADSSASG
jgi:tetratricopeptide (TPR) repeat protein